MKFLHTTDRTNQGNRKKSRYNFISYTLFIRNSRQQYYFKTIAKYGYNLYDFFLPDDSRNIVMVKLVTCRLSNASAKPQLS